MYPNLDSVVLITEQDLIEVGIDLFATQDKEDMHLLYKVPTYILTEDLEEEID